MLERLRVVPEEPVPSFLAASRRRTRWQSVLVCVGLGIVTLSGWFGLFLYREGLTLQYVLSVPLEWVRYRVGVSALLEPEMVRIPPQEGLPTSFRMGSQQGDDAELPVHPVSITEPFAIGKFEVTFEEYDDFARRTGFSAPYGEKWGRGRRPVIHVSWQEARQYARWLSLVTGKSFRLPTEPEWEYAARGGTQTEYPWGERIGQNKANCDGCGSQGTSKQTARVGSFEPNAWGLYDIAGNVWEWVEDCWHENYDGAPSDGSAWREEDGGNCGQRVVRGGSWYLSLRYLRAASRHRFYTVVRSNDVGFRLAQDL